MLKGKMAYLSPEVLQGHPADARADIFALGVTFYELLTNQMPFQGEREAVILQAIATQQPKDPREWNPSLDPDLSAIVFRALEKDPAARYQTAGEVRQAVLEAAARFGLVTSPEAV